MAHKYHALLKTSLYFERNYFFHLKNLPLSLSLVNLTQLGYLLFLGLTQYFVDTQICCLCEVTSLALPWLCPKHLTTDSQEALSTRLMNDKICSMHKISETLLQLQKKWFELLIYNTSFITKVKLVRTSCWG